MSTLAKLLLVLYVVASIGFTFKNWEKIFLKKGSVELSVFILIIITFVAIVYKYKKK